MEIILYVVLGMAVFWFIFGVVASKMNKRSYDEDTSIKDGAKSVVWFLIAMGVLAALGFVLFLLNEIL